MISSVHSPDSRGTLRTAKYEVHACLSSIAWNKSGQESEGEESSHATEYLTAASLPTESGNTNSSSEDSFLTVRSKASLEDCDATSVQTEDLLSEMRGNFFSVKYFKFIKMS